MKNKELSSAQVAEYRFLKGQVDRSMDDMYRKDPPSDAAQRLECAREQLRQFVSARRAEGINI